jgi:monooxygenase
VMRAIGQFPRQGLKPPWRLYQNYLLDILNLRFGPIADGTIEFSRSHCAPDVGELVAAPAPVPHC